MPSELLPVDRVTEIISLAGFLPPDFLPAPGENLRWQSGENGWWVGVDTSLPAAAPAPRSLEQVLSAADFPAGAVLLRTASSELRFDAPWPFGADIHWLKETAEGILRGAAGVRLQSAGQVRLHGQLSGEWLGALRREDVEGMPGIRVAVWRHSQHGAAAEASLRWRASMEPAGQASVRDMVAALLGIHPLEWVRSLLNELGSRRVEEFARPPAARSGRWTRCAPSGSLSAPAWRPPSGPFSSSPHGGRRSAIFSRAPRVSKMGRRC